MPTNLIDKFESHNQHWHLCRFILQHVGDGGISHKPWTIEGTKNLGGIYWDCIIEADDVGAIPDWGELRVKAILSSRIIYFPISVGCRGRRWWWKNGYTIYAACLGCVTSLFSFLVFVAYPRRLRFFLRFSSTSYDGTIDNLRASPSARWLLVDASINHGQKPNKSRVHKNHLQCQKYA